MDKSLYYAHKSTDGRLQTVAEHSRGAAELAEMFAGEFGFGEEARTAALFHDVGKYAAAFQARLDGGRERYEHSSAGMSLFADMFYSPAATINIAQRFAALLMAYAIAGHHSGLPDYGSKTDTSDGDTFNAKIKRRAEIGNDFAAYRDELGAPPCQRALPTRFMPNGGGWFGYQFLGRMLFSALVDADFLDTEAFMSPTPNRDGGEPFDVLAERFRRHMAENFAGAEGHLNERRAAILAHCLDAAPHEPGIFRLTVPTGGGKTLSSMAFALAHLRAHGLRRIIYVIPYVSIIRQTVEIFENIFGERNVLGHYSTADFGGSGSDAHSDAHSDVRSPAELAAENWDKPIIVTTNVQFFESLYANRTSACRKLHNISRSVIIFDEAQMLPVGLLRPCLHAMCELVKNYGCSAILCTATQPALEGLLSDCGVAAREICPDVAEMYPDFARTRYHVLGQCRDEDIIERLRQSGSALCVLNSRDGVREYYSALRGDGVFHLSTYMTPAHIGRSLQTIRQRLRDGERCLVISTSLIEAGVDVDFPVVFREMAGLDSIIQAGGRCNREGKRAPDDSPVYVFSREDVKNATEISALATITERVCELYDDISLPEAIHAYFERLYAVQKSERVDNLDTKKILPLINQEEDSFGGLPYREIANRFRLISNSQRQILIPNEENGDACDAVRHGYLTRGLLRRLARDTVGVYEKGYKRLRDAGVLSAECDGVSVLEDASWYSPDCGLTFCETGVALFS